MSRTYKVRRNSDHFGGVRKEWILVNKRGVKKFQRMVNKRCRRLDKVVISEGINEMIDDVEESIAILDEIFFDDWYEEDLWEDLWEDPLDSYEEDPWDPYPYEEGEWYESLLSRNQDK